MGGAFFDYLTSSAVSLTVAGNTGISPFLTLLLLGIVEISDPTLLNMGSSSMESVLASWYSIAVLGTLTILELVGKCIPLVDEMIDSVELFVVPPLSVLASLGTLGLLDLAAAAAGGVPSEEGGGDGSERLLTVSGADGAGTDNFLTFLKVVLVVWGVGLSLCIHLFKMIVRVTGLVCCAGLCQPCITMIEIMAVCVGVVVAIYIQQIAIVTCCLLLFCAIYVIRLKCRQRKERNDDDENGNGGRPTTNNNNSSSNNSDGRPTESSTIAMATAVIVDDDNNSRYVVNGCEVAVGKEAPKASGYPQQQHHHQPPPPPRHDEESPQEHHQPTPPSSSMHAEQSSLTSLTPMIPPPPVLLLHDESCDGNIVENQDFQDAPVAAIAVPLAVPQ